MTGVVTAPEALPREFELALNKGDLEGIVALYDNEAVIRVQLNEIRSGAAAVRAEMQQLVAARATIVNILRHGDVALTSPARVSCRRWTCFPARRCRKPCASRS